MEAKAYLRHARISPRKVQIVLDLITEIRHPYGTWQVLLSAALFPT